MKMLILASNPRKDLNLDREIRDLKEVIEKSNNRQQFEVEDALAVRVGELQDLLFKHKPHIVHFCGHGAGQPGLVFEGKDGGEQWVRTDALRDLFRLFSKQVGCVLLNACYSEKQANEIVQYIDYVIGMNQEIRDDAAISFSKGFYRALGYDCSIEEAYEFGCNAIQLEISGSSIVRSAATDLTRKAEVVNAVASTVIPEHLKPILKKKQGTLNAEHLNSNGDTPLSQGQRETLQWELAQEITDTTPGKVIPTEAQSSVNLLLPFQSLQQAPSSPRRRLTQLIAAVVFTGLCATGGLYGYRYWQNYQQWQAQKELQQSGESEQQRNREAAIELGKEQRNLEAAIELGKKGQYESAIDFFGKIPADSPLAKDNSGRLETWLSGLLKQAEKSYDDGEVGRAIELAKKIPENSTVYPDAKTKIENWTREKKTFDEIIKGLIVHDITGGRRKLQLVKNPKLIEKAENAIEEKEKIVEANKPSPPPIQPPIPVLPDTPPSDNAPLQKQEVEPVFREFVGAWNDKHSIKQLDLIAKDDFTSVSYRADTGERYAPKDKAHYDYADYADLKVDLAKKNDRIRVEVSNEQFIPRSNGEMLVKYSQHYSGPNYESWGTNELYFRRRGGKVEIFRDVFYRDKVRQ